MLFTYLNKKGQATLEYGIIIAVLVAGLIAMQTYLKRAYQGKLRQAGDEIGEQFSPGYTLGTRNIITNLSTNEFVTITTDNMATTNTISSQNQSRSVIENVPAFNQEDWGD